MAVLSAFLGCFLIAALAQFGYHRRGVLWYVISAGFWLLWYLFLAMGLTYPEVSFQMERLRHTIGAADVYETAMWMATLFNTVAGLVVIVTLPKKKKTPAMPSMDEDMY